MIEPPPLVSDQSKTDAEHLNLLAVFHFVLAGLVVLGVGFLVLHYTLMHFVFTNPEIWKNQKNAVPPPEFIFTMFKWFYFFFGTLIVTCGIVNLLSGLFIRQRKHRLFSIIVAALNCIQVPLGTVLGVFTIVILTKQSVQDLYKKT